MYADPCAHLCNRARFEPLPSRADHGRLARRVGGEAHSLNYIRGAQDELPMADRRHGLLELEELLHDGQHLKGACE